MTSSEQFADWQILRTIQLQAVATWILRDVLKRLRKLESEILSAMLDAYLDGTASGPQQRAGLRKFKADLDELITAAFRELSERIEADFDTLAEAETEKQREMLALWIGAPMVAKAVSGGTAAILGAPVRQWMGRYAGDLEFRINQGIQNGMNAGEDAGKLRRRVRGWDGIGKDPEAVAIPRPMGSTERGIEGTVRTGVQSVSEEVLNGLGERMPQSIRMGWQQISVLDSRTTQTCRAYAFKVWDRDYKPIGHGLQYNGGVPRHVNCLPGDSLISPVGRITAVSKRWYDGMMVRFKTANGYELACTPNHPILTNCGWVAAKLIQNGSRVICDGTSQFPSVSKWKNDNRISTIQEVVESFLVSQKFFTVKVPTSAPDFHGDGSESEVAIIGSDRSLTVQSNTSGLHHVEKLPFIIGTQNRVNARNGAMAKLVETRFTSKHSRMCGSRERQSLLAISAFHSGELLLASVPGLDVGFDKTTGQMLRGNTKPLCYGPDSYSRVEKGFSFGHVDDSFDNRSGFTHHNTGFAQSDVNYLAGDAKLARDILDGLTGSVLIDNVVSIECSSFHGYVYNLECEQHYYYANGIATHNCRSRIVPYLFDDGPNKDFTFREWLERLSAEQQQQIFGRRQLELWRSGKLSDQDLIRSQERAIAPDEINTQSQ